MFGDAPDVANNHAKGQGSIQLLQQSFDTRAQMDGSLFEMAEGQGGVPQSRVARRCRHPSQLLHFGFDRRHTRLELATMGSNVVSGQE
jgi:hypothetical protein